MIQPTRSYPILVETRRGHALDIIGVQTNRLWGEEICGSRSPDLDGDVGGCGDEGLVVLSKDNVVDPVGMCLSLLAELGGGRFRVEGVGIGERILFVVFVGG